MGDHLPFSENTIAGISAAVMGIIGYIVGFTLLTLIVKTPSFRNAFGYLCISHLVSHIGIYTANIFWASPALILEFDYSITHSFLGARVGQFHNTFWYATLYSLLEISVNRLMAIAFPLIYSKLFTSRNLAYVIGGGWILSALQCCVYFWSGCEYLFSTTQFSWVYPTTVCGHIVSLYLDIVLSILIITIIFVIDIVTFLFIRRRAKELHRSSSTNSQEQLATFKRNTIFFVQGCLSTANQALAICFYHGFTQKNSTKWERLAGSSLIFQLSHITDAIITILFIKPFRDQLFRFLHVRKEPIPKTVVINNSAQ